ncbi:MAG TPA: SAM-dependent methyltransferase [Calditerricola sp.]
MKGVELATRLAARIREGGPLSFAAFMEACLYDAQDGYYMRAGEKIGRTGDFYTAPAAHPVFGKALARALQAMREALGGAPLIEIGAGTGALARAVLDALQTEHPDAYANALYGIVERSPTLRRAQTKALAAHRQRVRWGETVADLVGREGKAVLVANEVLDALPVRVLRQVGETVEELHVGWDGARFVEVWRPCTEAEALAQWERIRARLRAVGRDVAEGQRVEVHTSARAALRAWGEGVTCGYWLLMDYGGTTAERITPERKRGTLRAFCRHAVTEEILARPGEQDLTADVDFSDLLEWGAEAGWRPVWYGTQGAFLLACGILRYLEDPGADPFSPAARQNRAIRHLVLGGGMGERFRVLLLAKGDAPDDLPFLSGMKKRGVG